MDDLEFITQAYLLRYPNSRRARTWAVKMVHIETENGVWRTGGVGYTWAGKPDALVLPFEEAQKQVAHCGPEKRAQFVAADIPLSPAVVAAHGEAVAFIQREALDELLKHKDASVNVASGLLRKPFGNPVPLYSADRIDTLTVLAAQWEHACRASMADAKPAVVRAEAAEARIAELAAAVGAYREIAPQVMTSLMATKRRDDLLLADAVHKTDDLARTALSKPELVKL